MKRLLVLLGCAVLLFSGCQGFSRDKRAVEVNPSNHPWQSANNRSSGRRLYPFLASRGEFLWSPVCTSTQSGRLEVLEMTRHCQPFLFGGIHSR